MQKIAIVTGSSSGLGIKTVELLIQKSFKVYGWDLRPAQKSIPNLIHQSVDVSQTSSISSALSEILTHHSSIDVLVNCAGISILVPLISRSSIHPLESFNKLLKINLIGTFDVSRQVSKYMQKGVIILVSSINAYQAFRFQTAYGASKGAVASMALPMSRDLSSRGTRVVSISPGAFDTPMTQSLNESSKVTGSKAIALGRFGQAEEFAHSVLFAIENDYLNGCNLDLNGGLVNPNI